MPSPSPPPADLDALEGPYESWIFGETGADFATPAAQLEGPVVVTALAELPPQHPLATSAGRLVIDDGAMTIDQPAIWAPASPAPAAGVVFRPVVLSFTAEASRTASCAALTRALGCGIHPGIMTSPAVTSQTLATEAAAAPAPVAPPLPAPGPALPQIGYRLNGKLAEGTFDPDFGAAPRPPAFAANPVIAAALPRGEAARHPLVITAIIDDGLPFAHPALLDSTGQSRVEFCWLQSAPISPEPAERTVLFGRELTRIRIDDLRTRHAGNEEAIYREAGLIGPHRPVEPLAGALSHGAMVLDLAAGRRVDDDAETLDRTRLILVELPAPAVMDTVGFGKDAYVLSALHYVFERARRIATAYGVATLPVVINFSFGFTGGPHDGTERLEQAMQDLVRQRNGTGQPTRLVMAAGNHFLARLYGEVTRDNVGRDGRFTIPWRIQPDDQTPNYLEIWYPPDQSRTPDLPAVRGPDGVALAAVPVSQTGGLLAQRILRLESGGRTVGQLSLDRFRGRRWRAMVILAPTEMPNRVIGAAAGLWQITLDAQAVKGKPGVIACRIQRDHSMTGPHQRGRQSYFDHPGDRDFGPDDRWLQDDNQAVFVRRFGSINGLGTQDQTILVGGAVAMGDRRDTPPARYASAGRAGAAAGAPGQVARSALSDIAAALPGIPAGGTRAGTQGRLSGTSAAAPQVTRQEAAALLDPPSPTARPRPARPVTDPRDQARLGTAVEINQLG